MSNNENNRRRKQKLLPGNHFERQTQANISGLLDTYALPPGHEFKTIRTAGAGAAYTSNIIVAPTMQNKPINKETLLKTAIEEGNVEEITKQLQPPVEFSLLSFILSSTAAHEKRVEIADLIFELAGAAVNNNYLEYSMMFGNSTTFKILLNNPYIYINGNMGYATPIVSALNKNKEEFIMALLNHPDIEITDSIIVMFRNAGKTHLLLQSHLPSSTISRVLEVNQEVGTAAINSSEPLGYLLRNDERALRFMNLLSSLHPRRSIEPRYTHSRIGNILRNRAWTRRSNVVKAWTAALAAREGTNEEDEIQNQAARLQEQLASPALTPAQKAGIAARARAQTKKANNASRNSRKSRRRRNTRQGRKY